MSYCVVFWQLGTNQETLAVNNLNICYHEMYNIMMIVHSPQSITWNQQVIVNIYIFLAIQIYFTNKEFNTDGFTKQFVRTKLLVGDLHLLRINSSCIYNLTNYFCTKNGYRCFDNTIVVCPRILSRLWLHFCQHLQIQYQMIIMYTFDRQQVHRIQFCKWLLCTCLHICHCMLCARYRKLYNSPLMLSEVNTST